MIIIMGIFLVICAGACNIYPLYLKYMMTKFNFTLKQVNLYGTFINMGHWIALPMGWIYDTYGPKISCVIGGFFMSGSYILLYMLLNSDIISISIIPFLVIGLILGQGSALCYTTAVTTNLKNFRFKESSVIVGLLTAHIALSPSVFTTYREAMKHMNISNYFIIVALFIIAVTSVCVFVFRNIKRVYNEEEEKRTYEKYKERKIIKILIFLSIIILIVYTFGIIINTAIKSDGKSSDELNEEVDEDNFNKFPLVIVYPCLQMFNFVVVILEIYGIFDKLYFKGYIDKMIIRQLNKDKSAVIIKENAINEIREISPEIKNAILNQEMNIVDRLGKNDSIYDNSNHINKNTKNIEINEIKIDDLDHKPNDNNINNFDNKYHEEFVELEMVPANTAKNQFNEEKINRVTKSEIGSDASLNKNERDYQIMQEQEKSKKVIGKKDVYDADSLINSISINKESNSVRKISLTKIKEGSDSDKKEKLNTSSSEQAEHSITFKQAVLSKQVIILFFILVLGVGSSIANLNNIEFIVTSISSHKSSHVNHLNITDSTSSKKVFKSRQIENNEDNVESEMESGNFRLVTETKPISNSRNSSNGIVIYSYIILYFVFSAFTKIISGIVLDYLININKLFFYLIFIAVTGTISQLVGIILNKNALLLSISLAGMAHGGYSTFVPVFVRNEFGLTHMGKILGVLNSGCAIGSLFVADLVFILGYEINSVDDECIGTKCFRISYIATSLFYLINLILSLFLLKDYLARFPKKKLDQAEKNKIHPE